MIEMEKHVKPAVILGKVTFGQDIVNELIELSVSKKFLGPIRGKEGKF